MHAFHHSGDAPVKSILSTYHRCGDGALLTNAVKCGGMKHPNRIKELREARGLSLQALADAVNSSPQQMSRLERGERRLSDHWMGLIAPILGVRPHELLVDVPVMTGEEQEFIRLLRLLPDQRRRAELKALQARIEAEEEDEEPHPEGG